MDGKRQYIYPRKNWSSVILWNCGHPSNKKLTQQIINTETGQFLHRFEWLNDEEIGELPAVYNWLVGWYKETQESGKPKIIHYTEGGPWFDNYVNCEYGANWEREKYKYLETLKPPAPEPVKHPFESLPPQITNLFQNILRYRVDPAGDWYGEDYEKIIKLLVKSDNDVWTPLQNLAGGGQKVNDWAKGMGYNNQPARTMGNNANAIDMCKLYRDVCRNNFIGAEVIYRISSSCQTSTSRSRKYMPTSVYIGSKTGTYLKSNHDCGWFQNGQNFYAIAVFTELGSGGSDFIATMWRGLYNEYIK
jgi:lipopolysaccharide biosynthesis glycosyltransferase